MPPNFYNAGDQAIYAAGDFFIPQERYRAAPYTVNQPTNPDEVPAGIPAVYQSQGGSFNPYNTNMSNVRQDYNAFPSRQAGEIYSKTFNPGPNPYATSMYGDSLPRAQSQYNLANQNISLTGPMTPERRAEIMRTTDDIIQDNRMKYATEGQYIDQYDPNYSSMTEAQKFMDNYPDYYGVPSGVPEEGIPGLIKGYLENSLLGKGVGMVTDFLGRVMPINERAIMENEARGAGIFTDDIGRIVTDDYNTAGGIMAGYNLNALTKEGSTALTDRKNTVMNTLENKYGLTKSAVDALRKDPNYTGPAKTLIDRLDLFDEFEDEINTINTKKKLITKMRADKKAADKKRREEEKAAAAAAKAAEESAKASAALEAQRRGRRPGSGGDGPTTQDTAASQGRSPGSSGSGTGGYSYDSGGRKGFGYGLADGGRVYYMDGGLADMLEIYD